MAKYVYPALFEPNELNGFCVSFPDIKGVFTEGAALADAIEMARDALCLMLYTNEINNREAPPPTPIHEVEVPDGNIVTLIECDTNYYKRYFMDKTINKTVTIPARLNYEAERAGLNFSQVLRAALEQQLSKVN